MTKGELAVEYFKKGYNCSQSVVLAFKDELNIDINTVLKISSPFGGGMGRLRLTCGAFSAITIIIGLKYGYDTPETGEAKMNLYKRVQDLSHEFEMKNGSLICAKLLNVENEKISYVPSERNADFYKKRPCVEIIRNAADIVDEYLRNNK